MTMTEKKNRSTRRVRISRTLRFLCVLLPVMTVVWMSLIFWMSAQPADDSEDLSLSVGQMVGRVLYRDFDSWPEAEQEAFARRIDHPVRKLAHGTEYMILGILLALDVRVCSGKYSRILLLPWLAGTLYACTDEWHQLYVPGRSGQLCDILIDSGGVLTGVLLATLAARLRRPGK